MIASKVCCSCIGNNARKMGHISHHKKCGGRPPRFLKVGGSRPPPDPPGGDAPGRSVCKAPVLCKPVDSDSQQSCPLADGSGGVLCPTGAPPEPAAARPLSGRQSALLAPPVQSVDVREAQWQATQHLDALTGLEERLEAVLHRPGDEQADMMEHDMTNHYPELCL